MLRDETRARLRQLIRQTAAGKPASADSLKPAARVSSAASSRLSSGNEVTNSAGSYWLVQQSLRELWPSFEPFVERWRQRKVSIASREESDDYREFMRWFPERAVFLDLETCGFAGSTVFLAGILHQVDGQLLISQYWARNYAEEKPLMQSLREDLQNQQVLITFNGKSFDWPQVRDRCILHSGKIDGGLPDLVHLDLLHLSRRRWKHQLPNCRLQTLEKFICGRLRDGDIPGNEIPQVYQNYVKTGMQTNANRILHHNALDLVTLLQLSLCIRD